MTKESILQWNSSCLILPNLNSNYSDVSAEVGMLAVIKNNSVIEVKEIANVNNIQLENIEDNLHINTLKYTY